MTRKASWVLFFFRLLGISVAWDGCEYGFAWRCGDTCVEQDAECKCGGEIFNLTSQMWCCNNEPCLGRGDDDLIARSMIIIMKDDDGMMT